MAKILIAEDDVGTRMVIAAGIEKAGHFVIQCSTGARAWSTLCDNPDISMVVTDVVMPEMDGIELVEKVRSDERLQELPILILSGKVGPKTISKFLESGATAFLPKPVLMGELEIYLEQNFGVLNQGK